MIGFKGASIKEKLTGICDLNGRRTNLKKINVSFIFSFYLGKINFSFNTYVALESYYIADEDVMVNKLD